MENFLPDYDINNGFIVTTTDLISSNLHCSTPQLIKLALSAFVNFQDLDIHIVCRKWNRELLACTINR